jgi:hypothetical protein
LKKILLALFACAGLAAQANTITTDFTDLWWDPSESGWGLNLVQQEDTAFATLFVYAANGSPTWYVGSALIYQGVQNGQFVFTGPLYRTTGPHFAAPDFQSSQVTRVAVGTMTFRAAQATTATVAYTVDGTTITKFIERQTWRNQNFTGNYRGAVIGQVSGCTSGNGPSDAAAVFAITQQGFAFTVQETGENHSCSYTGSYSPAGTIGVVDGSMTCSDNVARNFSMTEMKVGIDAFSGALNTRSGSCVFSGRIGGVRRN